MASPRDCAVGARAGPGAGSAAAAAASATRCPASRSYGSLVRFQPDFPVRSFSILSGLAAVLGENGCLDLNVPAGSKPRLSSLNPAPTLRGLGTSPALKSAGMNSGVAVKYGNDSSAELSEVRNC